MASNQHQPVSVTKSNIAAPTTTQQLPFRPLLSKTQPPNASAATFGVRYVESEPTMSFAAPRPSPFSLPFLARSGNIKTLIELKLVSLLVEVIPLAVLGEKLKAEAEPYMGLRGATYSTRSHLRRIHGRYRNFREQYHDKVAKWLVRCGNKERAPLTKEDIAICRSFVWASNRDLVEPIQTNEWIVLLRVLDDILNVATEILLERMGERGFKERSKQIKIELLCLVYGL